MNDRPTLWVFEVLDGEHDGVIYVNYTMPREATRADLLAALPDKEWREWCETHDEPILVRNYEHVVLPDCVVGWRWLVPVEDADE